MGVEFLIGLGLAAAGTAASMKGASDAKSAMNDQVSNELVRQQQIQQKSNKVYGESAAQSGTDTANQQIGAGAADAKQGYQDLQAAPLTSAKTGLAPTDAVTQGRTDAVIGQSNDARSKLQGYGNWQLHDSIKNMQAQQLLGIYGNQARSSQAVLPLEIQDASHAGDSWKAAGTGLSLAGSAVGMLGSMGGFSALKGGAAAVPPPNLPPVAGPWTGAAATVPSSGGNAWLGGGLAAMRGGGDISDPFLQAYIENEKKKIRLGAMSNDAWVPTQKY